MCVIILLNQNRVHRVQEQSENPHTKTLRQTSSRTVFLASRTGEQVSYTRVGVCIYIYVYTQCCYLDACKLLSVQTSRYLKKYERLIKNIFLSIIETFIVFLTVQLLLI